MNDASLADLLSEALTRHQNGDIEAAGRLYRKILEVDPDNADVQHMLALVERRSGDLLAACALMTTARRLRPAMIGLTENAANLRDQTHLAALAANAKGRVAEALSLLEAATELDPAHEKGWRGRASLARALGLDGAEVDALRQVLAFNPRDAVAWVQLILALKRQSDRAAALEAARRALAALPERVEEFRSLLLDLGLDERQYQPFLKRLHQHLAPRVYVEIGVFQGVTLALANPETKVVGVDPNPKIAVPLSADTQVWPMTSDAFFADPESSAALAALGTLDLAFIDGFHSFDQALKDFINLEARMRPDGVILIHDCYPMDAACAERTANPTARLWAGDVWKAILCLKAYRPDLQVRTLPLRPTGLAVVTGLNPNSTVLRDSFDEIVARFAPLPFAYIDGRQEEALNVVPADWDMLAARLPVRTA